MRSIAVGLLLTFSVLGVCQDLNKPVDYTTRAAPLPKVLAEFSKRAGVELFCDTDLDEEPLILSLHAVSVKEAMDKIALACAGEWKKTEQGYRLQSGAQAKALHDKAIQERADFFTKSIGDLEKAWGCDKPFDDAAAERWAELLIAESRGVPMDLSSKQNNPTARAFLRALRLLDPREVASLQVGQSVDFSSEPKAFERPLEGEETVFRLLVEEQERLGRVFDKLLESESLELQQRLRGRQSVKADPTRLIVHVNVDGPSRYVPMVTYPSFQAGNTYMDQTILGRPLPTYEDGKPHIPKRTDGKGLVLGPAAREIADHIPDTEYQGGLLWNVKPLSEPLKQAILHPTVTEPLSFATTDLVFAYAQQKGLNVALCPTDPCEKIAYTEAREGPITAEVFRGEMFKDELLISDTDGWLLGKPKDPLQCKENRLPRKELEAFYQSVANEGYVSLDSASRLESYAARYGDRDLVDVATRCLLGLEHPYPTGYGWYRPALRFLPTLTPEQRMAARKGTLRINVATLSGEQLRLFTDWVLSANISFSTPGTPSVPAKTALPLALERGTIEITQTDTQMATLTFPYRGIRVENAQPLEVIAFTAAEKEYMLQHGDYGTDSLRPGVRRRLWLRVVLPDSSEQSVALYDLHMLPVKPMTLKQFIAAMEPKQRAEFEAMLAKYRQEAKERAAEKPITVPPPPP